MEKWLLQVFVLSAHGGKVTATSVCVIRAWWRSDCYEHLCCKGIVEKWLLEAFVLSGHGGEVTAMSICVVRA